MLEKLSLNKVLDFKPDFNKSEFRSYVKCYMCSYSPLTNYNFIKYLSTVEKFNDIFLNVLQSKVYDFDATCTNSERFISIYELKSNFDIDEIVLFIKKILENYLKHINEFIDEDKPNIDIVIDVMDISNQFRLTLMDDEICLLNI